MMSIGLHLRMIGRPGRIGALDKRFFGISPAEGTPGSRGGWTLPITGLRNFPKRLDMSALF